MALDEFDIERIVQDNLLPVSHELEMIRATLTDMESAMGFLVKRVRERIKNEKQEPAS